MVRMLSAGDGSTTPPLIPSNVDANFPKDSSVITPYMTYMLMQELENAVTASGQTASHSNLTQLRDAILRLGNGYDIYGHGGPPWYVTSNFRVTLPADLWAIASATGEPMKVASLLNVDITASGVNGLDAGSEAANTWYYLYLIKHNTNGTVAGLFSTNPTAPTMPSGYTHRRLIGAVRNNNSSNFLQGRCRQWGGGQLTFVPDVQHQHSQNLAAGNLIATALAATSYTDLDCSSQVPARTRFAELWIRCGAALIVSVREKGTTHNGKGFRLGTVDDTVIFPTGLDASQVVQYKVSTSQVAIEVESWTMEIRG